jgi:PAS domain S-box-containing protein
MISMSADPMPVSEDLRIVFLSFLVAALASYTALDLTGPAARARRSSEAVGWTFAAATALAIGIWSMHFVGMQAFRIAIPVAYELPIVALSFLVALGGTLVSLSIIVRTGAARSSVIGASVLLGLCLAGMHYTGMAALRIDAIVRYDPLWVAISVLIAIVTSYAAFALVARFTAEQRLRQFAPKLLVASVLGVAIIAVHYSGMRAATFYAADLPQTGVVVNQQAVALAVALATIAVLGFFLFSALLHLRRQNQRRDEDRLRMFAGAVPNMVWTATANGEPDYWNKRFDDYTGSSLGQFSADVLEELLHADDRAAALASWSTAVGSGTPYRSEARLRRADGVYRWHVLLADPVRDADGTIARWFGSCTDIQEQKNAERILTVLSDVTQALSASLDPQAIALTLAEMVASGEAAYCEVQLYDDAGVLDVAARAGDGAAFDPSNALRAARVQDAGATLLTKALGIVPVRAGDEVLGWLICCNVIDDVRALVPELASRLGVAIANARVYAREHRVATTFQRAALDPEIPDVPGLHFSALYQAAHADASVGGDWYDAFRLPDGRLVLSVGDVAGSGLEAAVTMGSVRQSIRTAALINPDPVAVVEAVDRIVRAMGHGRFVTAFVAVYDPVCAEFVFANAGHPSPLLLRPDGTIVELGGGDLPLGLRQRGEAVSRTIEIEDGSLLVVYTDGLVEFDRDVISATARLVDAVHACDPRNAAPAIFDAVLRGHASRDDVAILAVWFERVLGVVGGPRSWSFDVSDEREAERVRGEFVTILREAGFKTADCAAAELVYGELIGNAYRYARGAVDVMLDVSGTVAVLHVLDRGTGFEFRPRLPADIMSERGRGLFLIKSLSDEFSMERRRTGGSHARAVLLGSTHLRVPSTMARAAI